MDAVMVLCHFCEQHGPAVLMCTQPLRMPQQPAEIAHKLSLGAPISSVTSSHDTVGWTMESSHNSHLSDIISSSTQPQSIGAVQDTSSWVQQSGACRSCSIVSRGEMGFITRDSAARVDYVSTQFPSDKELLAAVRIACMRCFSCETIPDREGAVYFGDDINRHVISYNFFLKDPLARGFQVKYSFLLITWNQTMLMNLWPFVVKHFEDIARRLQDLALRVNDEPTSSRSSSTAAIAASTNAATTAGPARSVTPPAAAAAAAMASLRLCRTPPPPSALFQFASTPPHGGIHNNGGGKSLLNSQAVAAGSAVFNVSSTPRRSRTSRVADSEVRSLANLMRDESIYYRIHSWFTWMLRTAGRNWTAVPTAAGTAVGDAAAKGFASPIDEDAALRQEERDAIFESSRFSSTRRGDTVSSTASGLVSPSSPPLPGTPAPVDPATVLFGYALGWTDGTVQMELAAQMRLLSFLCKSIGEEPFKRLIYYLGVGNQVIVHPMGPQDAAAFTAAALARLLPRGCVKFIANSPNYVSLADCNILSLTPRVNLTRILPISSASQTPYAVVEVSVVSTVSSTGEEDLSAGGVVSFDQLAFSVSFGEPSSSQPHRMTVPAPTAGRQHQQTRFEEGSLSPVGSASLAGVSPWGASAFNPPTPPSPSFMHSQPGGNSQQQPINSSFVTEVVKNFAMWEPSLKRYIILPPSAMIVGVKLIKQIWIGHARMLDDFQKCSKAAATPEEGAKKCFGFLATNYNITPNDEAVVRYWLRALSLQTRRDVCHPRPTSTGQPRSAGGSVASSATRR